MKLNSLFEVLERSKPGSLQQLKEQYPALADLLVPGLKLGDQILPAQNLAQIVEVVTNALTAVSLRAEVLTNVLHRRIQMTKRLGFCANVLAALTSAGLLSTIFSGQSGHAALSIALVTFVATLVTATSQYIDTFGSTKGGLSEAASKATMIVVTSERLLRELDLWRLTQSPDVSPANLLQQANQMAAELRYLDLALAVPYADSSINARSYRPQFAK